MMILIAGPYRSGTGDDPDKIAANVRIMESYALPIFRLGHIPLLGEWLALPLVHLAGSKCDGVLRVGGESKGADQMVAIARQNGLKIFTKIEQIPPAA